MIKNKKANILLAVFAYIYCVFVSIFAAKNTTYMVLGLILWSVQFGLNLLLIYAQNKTVWENCRYFYLKFLHKFYFVISCLLLFIFFINIVVLRTGFIENLTEMPIKSCIIVIPIAALIAQGLILASNIIMNIEKELKN